MTQRVEPTTFQRIEEGKVKYATARVEVPANDTEQFVISSPPSEDVKGKLLSLIFRTSTAFNIDYRENFSIDTAGTEMHIANTKTSSSDTTDLVFEYGGTYSGMTTVAESYVPGSTENKGAGTSVENIELIVANESELMIEATNQNGSNAGIMSVVFIFAEEDPEQ